MRKQCFCETKPRHEPYRCAKEGQTCKKCNGVLFYGLYKRNGIVLNLDEMMSKNYRFKEKYLSTSAQQFQTSWSSLTRNWVNIIVLMSLALRFLSKVRSIKFSLLVYNSFPVP